MHGHLQINIKVNERAVFDVLWWDTTSDSRLLIQEEESEAGWHGGVIGHMDGQS